MAGKKQTETSDEFAKNIEQITEMGKTAIEW